MEKMRENVTKKSENPNRHYEILSMLMDNHCYCHCQTII